MHFGFRGPSALFSATATKSRLGLAIYKRKKFYDITARTKDYSIPLNILMEEAAEAVGGSGGGHPHASGARIPFSKVEDFLELCNGLMRTKFRKSRK
jgi:nanoRNase/pAp phosphatase (c-di-AMP/oligoRNAs hydrolase)